MSGLLKRGLVFCIKFIDLAEMLIFGGGGIHQIKDWYYLEPSQISKVEVFAAMNFFCKKLQFKCLTGFTRRFQKHFYVLLVKILHFEKKTRNIYTSMLKSTFPKEDVID